MHVELPSVLHAERAEQLLEVVHRALDVVLDALGLVFDDQTALQGRIVRRDADGARVAPALQRLDAAERKHEAALAGLTKTIRPLVRNPADMGDLLSYQLVSGAVSAVADPYTEES